MEEKREFLRSDLSVDVGWKKIASASDKLSYNFSKTKNISAAGACLIVDKMLNVGDVLELEVRFSGEKTIYSRGKVMWIYKHDTGDEQEGIRCCGGVEFLDLSNDFRKWFDKYIANFLDFERI